MIDQIIYKFKICPAPHFNRCVLLSIIFLFISSCASKKENVEHKTNQNLKVSVLNVGNASCNIVLCPGSKNEAIVYDCGVKSGRSVNDMSNQDIQNYFSEINAKYNISLFVSHADLDHYSIIDSVLDYNKVNKAYIGGDLQDYKASFVSWLSKINEVNHGKQLTSLLGKRISCDQAHLKILTANRGNSKNAQSLMLDLSYRNIKFLFTGDAEGSTELDALKNIEYRKNEKVSTIVFASHHGAESRDSNSSKWISSIKASTVIYSAGTHSGHAHPRCIVRKRYLPFLNEVDSHAMSCFEGRNKYQEFLSNKSEYNTRSFGKVEVISDGFIYLIDGVRSKKILKKKVNFDSFSWNDESLKGEPKVSPNVKLSISKKCHASGSSQYYNRTKKYTSFNSLVECFASAGVCPLSDRVCLKEYDSFKRALIKN